MAGQLEKKVIDFAVPIEEYLTIHCNSSLLDALALMSNTSRNRILFKGFKYPLVVVDDDNNIIGKVGPFRCLRALNQLFCIDYEDIEMIIKSDEYHFEFLEYIINKQISEQFINWEKKNYAKQLKIMNFMYPISESIDGEITISIAIMKIIDKNILSMPVSIKSDIVGFIHLFDLFNEISKHQPFIKQSLMRTLPLT